MFFPNNQLRQTAPINPNPHTHHTITYQTAEPQGQGVLRWAIRGGTKGGTQRGAEFSSLVACVWRVPFLGRFSDLVKRCETCTSLALRVSLYISFTNCRRNGWADEHYRWLWNFKIYLSSPVSPKTLQSMSFAEEDVKGTLAEGSQQMSRVYGRGKIGLAIYSTAEGCWRIIFKGRFLIWSYIWLLAPRFFLQRLITVCGTLPADSDGQCEISTLASGTPPASRPLCWTFLHQLYGNISSATPYNPRPATPQKSEDWVLIMAMGTLEITQECQKKVRCRAHIVVHKAWDGPSWP